MSSGGISYPLWNMDLGKEKGKCNSPVKQTRFCGFYGMSCVHPLQVQGMGLPDSKERHMRIPRARWKALLEVARYAAELRPPVFGFFSYQSSHAISKHKKASCKTWCFSMTRILCIRKTQSFLGPKTHPSVLFTER